jgi:xanthine/CO dehydrogenase XdhC/CoxF family maturation factor
MCTGGARVAALQQSAAEENGRVLTASDAYVVCGFGEIGQRVCDELSSVFEGSDLIAFDRDPKRVAVGMQRQVRVIYGDGASETLLKASGIDEPRAIIVSYSQSSRCLDATRRLRDVFPQSPIYVRAASEEEVTPLLEAGATEVVVEWPHRYLAAEAAAGRIDRRTVLCVLTHDPKFDVPLLEVALRLPEVAYIGAMGSRRTHDDRIERLRERGLTEAEIARMSSPIGLDLGARTPEETAVSIVGEIIARRWGGGGQPLAEIPGRIHHD